MSLTAFDYTDFGLGFAIPSWMRVTAISMRVSLTGVSCNFNSFAACMHAATTLSHAVPVYQRQLSLLLSDMLLRELQAAPKGFAQPLVNQRM